jgi:hypothetical protein
MGLAPKDTRERDIAKALTAALRAGRAALERKFDDTSDTQRELLASLAVCEIASRRWHIELLERDGCLYLPEIRDHYADESEPD